MRSFLAFLTALFLLYDPFKGIGRANSALQQGLAAAVRVFELLDTRPEVSDRPDAGTLARVWLGAVSFQEAQSAGGLRLEGPRDPVRAFPGWFLLSRFAKVERLTPA